MAKGFPKEEAQAGSRANQDKGGGRWLQRFVVLRGYSRGGVPAGRLRLPRSEMPTDRGRPDVGQRGGRAARKLLVVETTLRSLSITPGLAAVSSSVRSGKGVRGATEGPLSRSCSSAAA